MDAHNKAVAVLATRVAQFHEEKKQFRVFHGSTNSTRPPQYSRQSVVDVSKLNNVIKVDAHAMTALVEPNVSMGKLVEATRKQNMIPRVVMEFPEITVGGGYSGHSGESSSFREGLFDKTITFIEIILSDGTIATSSTRENPELLGHAAESAGTLGVITLLEVRLMPAREYVELTYHPVLSTKQGVAKIEESMKDETVQYVDGIMFRRDQGLIMAGRLTDSLPKDVKTQRFTRPSDPWFYLHAKNRLKKNGLEKPFVIGIPLVDYLFRYDRCAFWIGPLAFRYFGVPCNRVTRRALNRFMHAKKMYHALHECGLGNKYVCQDIGVPVAEIPKFVDFIDENLGIWPLWFCPIDCDKRSAVLPRSTTRLEASSIMMINVGIWGKGSGDIESFIKENRALEDATEELGGQKALYAQTFYSEEDFWKMYDKEYYESVRSKYNASNLPTIYDKVKFRRPEPPKWWQRRPLDGTVGVARYLMNSDYLFRGR